MYQQNNSFVYIHIGYIVYVEEKVRKYAFKVLWQIFPRHENKRRRKNKFLIKQLAKHLILSQGWLIKRTEQNEPFVTKFPFILTNLGIWKSCRRMTQIGFKEKSRTADHIFTLKSIIDITIRLRKIKSLQLLLT